MLDERYTVLLISATDKARKNLSAVLAYNGFKQILSASTAGTARRIASDRPIDLAMINSPLSDDFGVNLAKDLEKKNISVLLFVSKDVFEQVAAKVEPEGIVVLAKPMVKGELDQAIRITRVMRGKMTKLEARASSMEEKMKEIRLVNRAKWLLIDRLKMSEVDAHRYIEKSAMDDCVNRGTIAENIIKIYDT